MIEQALVDLSDLFDREGSIGEPLAVEPLQQVKNMTDGCVVHNTYVEGLAVDADPFEEWVADGIEQVPAVGRDVHLAVIDTAVHSTGGGEKTEPGTVPATHNALVAIVVVVELIK